MHVPNRLAVPGNKDIPLVDARQSAWSLWVNAHNHRARSVTAIEGDRLKAKTEIAAGDVTLAFELCCDALDCARWYDENTSTRSKHRHANRLPGRVEHEAAFGALPQTQIKLDPRIDLATTERPPGSRGARHHAERNGRLTILGAYRDDQPACLDRLMALARSAEDRTVDPQQCDIGGGVTSNKLRRERHRRSRER